MKKGQDSLLAVIKGRIDTNTAIDLGREITNNLDDVSELTLDFAQVEYVSSIGLRVILDICTIIEKQGTMKLINVNNSVMTVFEMTGFTKILTIE